MPLAAQPMDRSLLEPIERDIAAAYAPARPSTTYWQDAWRRLKANKMAVLGLATVIGLILLAILGPIFSKYAYSDQDLFSAYGSPSALHWFGTDELGRDLFTRVTYGARISLFIGVFASIINLTIGVLYGGISGFIGGRTDELMMRIVDILYSIPTLIYVILLMIVLKPGLPSILVAIGISYWLGMARIVRGQVLSLKEQDFVLAARTIGASRWRILLKHLVPNSIGAIIVTMTLAIPEAIFTEAWLSYLGLGVSAPMASWGTLAEEGVKCFMSYPFVLFFPAIFICVTMLAFNFLGDGLRDALDPKQRR